MLKLALTDSSKEFASQLETLSNLVAISLDKDGLELSCKQGNSGLTVVKKANKAEITYQKKCEFFRGVLTLMEHETEEKFQLSEAPSFQFNGEMIDNSRNSVLNMKTAKEVIMYSAMLGLDNILLYNEETFEVKEHPYFGYMRMGYSQKDVKELNAFGKDFGVTIIPCIQTLAHLAQTLRWSCYWDIRDHGDTLLVEEEKTYQFIDDVMRSWRECVDTDIINIGMDEAFYLGRGQYIDKNGYKPRSELMIEHLKRVLEICRKYNFKAMMWSDMFFRLMFGEDYYTDKPMDKELLKMVPTDVMLVYWDYYSTDENKYDMMFKRHLQFNNEIGFAGGAWKWSGIVPAINHSHKVSKMALRKAKENGVSTVFTTAWGDNGAEASIFTLLPTLALHGEESYSTDGIDEKVSSKLKALTGYTLEDFFELCEPNKTPTNNLIPHYNPCKYLFFQDVLMGLFDYHVTPEFPAWFKKCSEDLASLAKKDSKQAYLFDTLAKLCSVLELKCDIGVRLKTAYDKKDKVELARLANEICPEILARIDVYYAAFKKQWYNESRTGGFDVQDLRFGGLIMRIKTAMEMVNAYANSEIDAIMELEQPRLPFDCRTSDEGKDINTDCNYWNYISTPNVNSIF
ncbi:beta-N-acetylhexosaminidase [Paludicola sp. MB14-C6]|uniref:beta-N-acetylhexosaminidase n=1 Tax=Paludihabitans sp. MB14-C6 TaxID=3070656 RepID=UPI0027DE844A|nr:beta-N-acetylhexosaminidase [Paludicola sp. MB14-C6]WMJ21924.1 beta-N-acetylhexosaminidase [Paludicola sp. MB14-C6]